MLNMSYMANRLVDGPGPSKIGWLFDLCDEQENNTDGESCINVILMHWLNKHHTRFSGRERQMHLCSPFHSLHLN